MLQLDYSSEPQIVRKLKNCLDEVDDNISDDDLTTNEMIDKYAKIKDSSADVDYTPSSEDELSTEEFSGEAESEDERTESRKQLNGELIKVIDVGG